MSDNKHDDDTGKTGCAYTETEGMWPSFRNVKSGMWPMWRRKEQEDLVARQRKASEQQQPLPDPHV